MTFTTMALIGLGAAGAFAATKAATTKKDTSGRVRGNTAAERQAVSASNSEKAAAIGVTQAGGRTMPDGAVATGRATTREDYKAKNTAVDAPPSTAGLASANTLTAYAAGERARKRASAGGSVLTRAQQGMPGPGGSYPAKTLLGS